MLYFLVLTVVFTWPLSLQMHDSVIGWVGDNYYFVWLIGWVRRCVFELHRSPMFVPYVNYPEGASLACTQMAPAMVLTALPFALAGGDTFGYNAAMLLTFPLSGLAMYYWTRRMTGSTFGGLVAGTIFAFSPYRIQHMLGHFNLMGTQWLPLYFLALTRVIEGGGRWRRNIALCAALAGIISLNDPYMLFFTIMLSVVYLAGWIAFAGQGALRDSALWKRVVLLAAAAAPLAAIPMIPYALVARGGAQMVRPLEEVNQWCASLGDFLVPSRQHMIWGEWFNVLYPRKTLVEHNVYLGVVAMVLAVFAFRRADLRRTTRLLVFCAIVSFVLALGTTLHAGGESVRVAVPGFLKGILHRDSAGVPMPGMILYRWLPFYSSMRVWLRYGLLCNLFLGALAGIGAAWLASRTPARFRFAVSSTILALIILDFLPFYPQLERVQGRAADLWLGAQRTEGAAAQFPFSEAADPQQNYYSSLWNRPSIGGCFGFLPHQYREILPAMTAFPSEQTVATLRRVGVRYVLVDARKYPDLRATKQAIDSLGFKLAEVAGLQLIYELPPLPPDSKSP